MKRRSTLFVAGFIVLASLASAPNARAQGLPNVIEVGDERYDDVRMCLDLGRDPYVVLRGSGPGGPGSSPRRS